LKVEEFTSADTEPANGRCAAGRLGEPEFSARHARGEIVKAADSGKETPVSGSLFDGLSPAQFAVCNFISDSIRKAYELKISFENPEGARDGRALHHSERD
jgi:hypothetical protein